jgi:elongation factor P hydroxylase
VRRHAIGANPSACRNVDARRCTTEWALERPTINDRFYWYLVDGSENHLQQEFKRSETRRRLYSADGSAVLVHGKPYVVSESQKKLGCYVSSSARW